MLKDIIDEIEFKNTKEPIDLFFTGTHPYKKRGYIIRGQIEELQHTVNHYFYLPNSDNRDIDVFYHFMIIVLVNKNFNETNEIFKKGFSRYFLYARKKNELTEVKNQYFKEMKKALKNFPVDPQQIKSFMHQLRECFNPPLTLNAKDVNIEENQYIENSIKKGKKIILLDMKVEYSRTEFVKKRELIKKGTVITLRKDDVSCEDELHEAQNLTSYFDIKRIYNLFALHFSRRRGIIDQDLIEWFDNLFQSLYWDIGHQLISKDEYNFLRDTIGNWAYEWISKQKISDDYIKYVREFMSEYRYVRRKREREDTFKKRKKQMNEPIVEFCCKFFDDLIEDLIEHKKIKRCKRCGNVFKYSKSKEYCSPKDGIDCGKSARNLRQAQKREKKRLKTLKKPTKN